MSLVNAVHVLLEVAAGRRNLSAAEADELHDAVDGIVTPEPEPEPEPPTAEDLAAFRAWQANQHQPAQEGVNLDVPADA